MAQNQILEEMQGLQSLRIRFWGKCKACNGSDQILEELQGVQWLKTGFYEDCRVCNGPKPGFT